MLQRPLGHVIRIQLVSDLAEGTRHCSILRLSRPWRLSCDSENVDVITVVIAFLVYQALPSVGNSRLASDLLWWRTPPHQRLRVLRRVLAPKQKPPSAGRNPRS